MAVLTKTALKNKYLTGAIPTQSDYSDFIDTTGSVDQDIVGTAGTITIPARSRLTAVVMWSATANTFKIGTAAGLNDIDEMSVGAGNYADFDIARFSIAGEVIHITATTTDFSVWYKIQ